jgi:hypothetical protein
MIQGRLSIMGMAVYYLWIANFSLLNVVQIGSGVHPSSYPMATGGKAARA